MAVRFYGRNFGQTEFSVTDTATTSTLDVEVQVNLANIPAQAGGARTSNNDVILALKDIINYLSGKGTRIT